MTPKQRARLVLAVLAVPLAGIAARSPTTALVIVGLAGAGALATVLYSRGERAFRPRGPGFYARVPLDGSYPDFIRAQIFPATFHRSLQRVIGWDEPAFGTLTAEEDGLQWRPSAAQSPSGIGMFRIPAEQIERIKLQVVAKGEHRLWIRTTDGPEFWMFISTEAGVREAIEALGIPFERSDPEEDG